MKIEQGQIWEVTTKNFLVNPSIIGTGDYRKVLLKKGEKIEIRYPFAWHFRTYDDFYFQANEEEILKHCKPYGIVFGKVRFQNIAKLKDIIKLRLFDKIK